MAHMIAISLAWVFTVSLAYSIVPGAVTLERGARSGIHAALGVRLGALAGTLAWAVLAFTGVGVVLGAPAIRLLFGLTSAGILGWLTCRAISASKRHAQLPVGRRHARRAIAAGATIALTSPLELAFWVGMREMVPATAMGTERLGRMAIVLAGFILADLLCTVVLVTFVAWGRQLMNGQLIRWAHLLGAIGLAFCGGSLLLHTTGPVM